MENVEALKNQSNELLPVVEKEVETSLSTENLFPTCA
jgi:hypothetical protein